MADVEKPAPDANEALVKVLALSVNPADWHCLRGKPVFSRATLGLRRPMNTILGVDVAGLVEAVGSGVGHFAVQIAKSYGAEVTGVTSTRNIDFVRSLGADHVIDYTREDFTRTGQAWDRILDTIGNRSVSDLRRALAPGGRCAVIGFTTMGKLLGVGMRGGEQISLVSAHASATDLELLGELIEAGELRPVIDRRYPFVELPEAIRYLERGRAQGKVVVGDVA